MRYLYLIISIAIIAAICFSSLSYWQDRYPGYIEFYNIAYQASNAVGFLRCGGFTLINFWAPDSIDGVPNTYFPFFQIIELLMLALGASIYFLTYWLTWLMLPLSFLIMLFFSFRLFGARVGLYAISLVSLPFIWTDRHLTNPAQSLTMILIMLVILCLVYKRYITAFILSLCCMATHTMGLIVMPCIFLYGIHERHKRKPVFIMLGLMALLAVVVFFAGLLKSNAQGLYSIDADFNPALATKFHDMGANLFTRNLGSAILGSFKSLFSVKDQNHVFLGWLAVAGLIICYMKRGKFLILPSMFLAFFPIAWTGSKVRFWGMPAITIFSLLGAVSLAAIHGRLENMRSGKVLGVAFFILVFIASHFLFYNMSDVSKHLKTPTMVYLNKPDMWHHPRVFAMKEKERIIELVKENVEPDEFFYIHGSYYFNNYVAANSFRSAFIPEGVDYTSQGIKLIVERFNAPSNEYSFLEKVNEEFDFSAYVLADASRAAKVTVPRPLVSIGQLNIGFIVMGGLILADIFIPRKVNKRRQS